MEPSHGNAGRNEAFFSLNRKLYFPASGRTDDNKGVSKNLICLTLAKKEKGFCLRVCIVRGRLGNLRIPLFSSEEKTKCKKTENFEKPSSEKQSREDSIEYLNICNKGIIL